MKHPQASSRRQFLKLSGLTGAASILPGCTPVANTEVKLSGQAKNVIYLMVDGLCNGTVGLAHHWQLRHKATPLNWMRLFEHEGLYRAYQDTASANSPVTDSAAAASAWGSGQRVNNGSINVDPSGKSLKPILSYAKEAGKATGLVTSCRITHATPAGFSTSVPKRGMEDAIAQQYLEREIDVLLGGGARHFLQTQEDGTVIDYLPQFEAKGYQIVKTATELSAVRRGGSLLGLFSKSHIPYAIDRQNDRAHKDVPNLVDMFRAALNQLEGVKNGFVLQVEGGRVDHAAHGNDAGGILHEFLEFDACIPVALKFIESHPDTMLVVTTDHGTGGCQLDGAGSAYLDSGPALDRINQLRHSFEWLQQGFEATGKFDPVLLKMALGIDPTDTQAAIVQAALDAKVEYLSGALNQAFGKQLKELTAVGWSSDKHTSECVELFAFGPGSETIPPLIKNYEIFGILTKALGIGV